MIKKGVFIIMICLLVFGCEHEVTTTSELNSKIESQIEYLEEINRKNDKILNNLNELHHVIIDDHKNNKPEERVDFWTFLNLSRTKQNSFIVQFEHSGMGGLELSFYDVYMISFLKQIFDPFNNIVISKREDNAIDKQLALNESNYMEKIGSENYLFIKLNEELPISILDYTITFNKLVMYVFDDKLLISIYKDSKFLYGFSIQPDYYIEIFVKLGELKKELLDIQCGNNEDC